MEKLFLLLFAFLSSPRSISKCGKYQNFWSGGGGGGGGGLLLGLGQLEGKLRWLGKFTVSYYLTAGFSESWT